MRNEILKETDQIINFIDAWQINNKYNGKLHKHNQKFRSDLKTFFESSNFKHHTLEELLNGCK